MQILVIGLSNIGDAVLMSPVIARLSGRFPQAHLTLLVGERARPLFAGDPRVHDLVCLDDFPGWMGRLRLVKLIWQARPDLVIDLRQTLLPLVWKPWRSWRYLWPLPKQMHRQQRHLLRLSRQAGLRLDEEDGQPSIWISPDDQQHVEHLMRRWGLASGKRLVIVCPGARSHIKRWYTDRFSALADRLIEEADAEVVFTGEPDESEIIRDVMSGMRHRAHNAVGCTTVRQLAALMQRAHLVITNDSASLHAAVAVGTPVLALFGPTDPAKYGPTGAHDRVIQRTLFCAPCERALCRYAHECMRFIHVDEVYQTAKEILEGRGAGDTGQGTSHAPRPTPHAPRRILVIRLDRIGDVVLSTPVLETLRKTYPAAFIAMMVRPACREVVEGHPFLNEVLLYDKDVDHKGMATTIRFARALRSQHFDTAIVLHPSNRSHWIPWFAGIPVRIGYDRKCGWLLTHRLAHRKQEGARHEAEYTLDLVRALGINPDPPRPVVPVRPEAVSRITQLLEDQGIDSGQTLVGIHPSASDGSKRWPAQRFAQLADRLADSREIRVVLVAGPADAQHAQHVEQAMRHRPLNVAGRLSVGELAALLARCRLLVSNDSGPVHLAAAVGTPVVALFGRAQPGVNATRWRPLGPHHVVLDKSDPSRFSAIDELSVEEVFQAAVSILNISDSTGILGTGGKATKALLEERAKDREREDR